MSSRINFTKRTSEALPLSQPGSRATYYDIKIPGLILRKTAQGTRTFQVYRKVNGHPERVTLGTFPAMTVEQMRKRADEVNAIIAKGQNPNAKRRALQAEMTLGELFDLYLERHAKVHKRSWQEDQAQYTRYLKPWANRKLSIIRKVDIQALHAKADKHVGIYAADRLLALLHTLFNLVQKPQLFP